jgi:hypothetical protein
VVAPGTGLNGNGYVGSTITVNGTNFQALGMIIKVGGSGGTVVGSYTFNSSTQITFSAIDASGTIYIDNGTAPAATSGSSYTTLGYITQATGAWATAGTWLGAAVPPSASTTNIKIAHNVTSTSGTTNVGQLNIDASTTLTITAATVVNINTASTNSGTITNNGTLSTAATYTNSGTMTTNGTFQLNSGGWSTGNNFVYGVAGTLNFNSATTYTVNNGDVFWPTASGPVNVSVLQGGLTLNSASRTVTGTFATAAGVTQTSSTLTISGINQLNFGGFFNSAPTYSGTATLVYNTSYGISNEWTGNSTTATVGIPFNVTIQNLGGLTFPTSDRGIGGNFTISSGSATLNGTSGDLYVGGNFVQNGTFTANGRAVFFNGGAAQSISGSGAIAFSYLILNNTSGGVTISNNASVTATTSDVLQLLGATNLNIASGVTFTVSGNGGNIRVNGGTRVINFNAANSIMTISGTKTVSATAGGLLSFTSTAANGNLRISAGVDFGSALSTIGNNTYLQIENGGFVNTNPPTYASGSTLVYNSGTNYGAGTEWTSNATTGIGVPHHVLIGNGINTTCNFGASTVFRQATGNFTISTSSSITLSTAAGGDLYVGGNFTNSGTYTHNTRALFLNGTGAQVIAGTLNGSGATNFLPYLFITNTAGIVSSAVSMNVGTSAATSFTQAATGNYVQSAGTFTLVSGALGTINGTFKNTGATISNVGTMTVSGTGTYEHAMASGTIPTCTWVAGSLCYVTGSTTSAPGGLVQSFSDFTWECSGQSASFSFSGTFVSARDVKFKNTGSGTVSLVATTAMVATYNSLTVSNASSLAMVSASANTNTVSLAITTNVIVENSASFTVSNGSGAGTVTMNVTGSFSNTSSNAISLLINGGSKTSVTLNIAGGYTQNNTGTAVVSQSTGSGRMNITGGSFTLTTGTFNISSGSSTASKLIVGSGLNANINGGTLNIATAGTGNFELGTNAASAVATGGALTINGGTLNVANGGTGILDLYDNLNLTSGTLARVSGTATVNFIAQGVTVNTPHPHNVTQSAGTVSGTITFNVGRSLGAVPPFYSFSLLNLASNVNFGGGSIINLTGASAIDFSTYVLSGNVFNLASGGNAITGNTAGFVVAPTLSGSVQTTTRTFSTSANFIFYGSSAQVTGSATPASCNFLSIANTAGVTLTNSMTLLAPGQLTFITPGNLILGTSDLTLSSTVAIAGASASAYVQTNSTGQLKQTVGAGVVSYPVGNSAYNPMTLDNTSGTSDIYGVRVLDVITSPAPLDPTKLINRYWNVTEGTAGGSNLTVTAQYNSGEENANFAAGSQLRLDLFTSLWTDYNSTSSGSGPFVVTSATTYASAGTFGIGKDDGFRNPTTTYTWVGTVDNTWIDPGNWAPATSIAGPTSSDHVIINAPGLNTLDITGTHSVIDFDLSGTGTFIMSATGNLTINGNLTYSSSGTPTFNCASTLNIASPTSQTIPAFNYGNLNLSGGARVLASSGTIGICGTFTRGAGGYTITGSTVNFNGAGAQTIATGTYNNLTISGNRGGATITLPSGTIDVAATFNPTVSNFATSLTGNTFNFSSASAQNFPAFFYYNVTNTGNGNRTWASSGVIDINFTFSPGSGTHTITGSTVRYSDLTSGTATLTNFTSNVAGRQYNNLEIVGGASSAWKLASGFNLGVAGNFELSGAGTFAVATNATANTMIVDGNVTLSGSGNIIIANTATSALTNSLTVVGNTNINSGIFTCVGATTSASPNTTVGNLITNNLTIAGTGQLLLEAVTTLGTASTTVTVNGDLSVTSTTANAINLGASTTSNAANVINIKGDFTKSGTGTLGFTGTFNPTAGYFFNNGSGTQQFSHSGAAMTAGNFTVAANSTLQLNSSFSLGSNASASSLNTAGNGILDFGTQVVSAGNAANTFNLSATGSFVTANTSGVGGSLSGFTVANCTFSGGATFVYNGASAQNTGVSSFPGVSLQYNLTWLGTTSLTLDKSWDLAVFNFTNNGLILLGNFNISLASSGGALTGSGFGTSKMFVTNGTGTLSRAVTSGGTGLPFTWPIGENTGVTEYSPVTIASGASFGIAGSIAFRVVDGVQPNNSPATVYLTRYWPCTLSAGMSSSYTLSGVTFTYDPSVNDVVPGLGSESLLKVNSYSTATSFWTQYTSSVSSPVLSTSSISGASMPAGATYDITGRVDLPLYYQTVGSGNWTSTAVWEVSTDPLFVSPSGSPAVVAPTNINSAGVFIRSTHTVTVNTNVTGDDVIIYSGGTLQLTGNTFTLANGVAAPDLTVNSGGTLLCASATNNSLVVATGASMTVDGLFMQAGSASPDLTNNGTITIGATGTYEHARNAGIVPTCTWTAGVPGATCLLSGITNNIPTGLAQSFYHFTVNTTLTNSANCSGALQTINGNFNLTTNHASFEFRLGGGDSYTLNIAGDFIITDGIINANSNGGATSTVNVAGTTTMSGANSKIMKGSTSNHTWNFNGDFTQNAGTIDFNTSSATGSTNVISFKGSAIVINGTIQASQGGLANHTLRFDKASGPQTLSFGGTNGAGGINWNIGNSTTNTVQLLTNLPLSSSSHIFTVNNGSTFDMGPYVLSGANTNFILGATAAIKSGHVNGLASSGAVGNVQNGGATRTFPATSSYFYNGTANQVTGNGLPTTLTGTGKLTISNTGTSGSNTVTLTTNNTTTPQLNLTSGFFAIGSGQTLIISSTGTVNQSGTGDFAVGATGGMLRFSTNGGSFTGTCSPFSVETNGTNCGVNFGSGTVTIQSGGVFNINTGGFVSTNAPAYASGSSLWYLTGGTYGRGLEWSAISGKGYPHHVVVAGSTTLNPASAGAANAAVPFRCGGNLTINSGANIFMNSGGNNMTVPLIVNGNINLVGSLAGSNSIGGDIELKGNWNNNGVAVTNFFPNSRTVTFNGSSNQNIGGSNTTVIPFAFLTIDNTAGVTLTAYNVEVNNQLNLTNGKVTLGAFNLKLNGLNTPLVGGTSSNYIVTNSTGVLSRNFNNVATLYPVGPDASTYSPVTLQQSGTADDITVLVKTAPAFVPGVADLNQMVNLQWTINESTSGGNNLSSNFQWPLSSEAPGFIRGSGVFQGDYTGGSWQVRASALSGGNPYLSSSSVNFMGTLSNTPFVVGNINGIIGCVATIASGDWHNTSTWSGGNIPPTSSTACIGHTVQITSANTNALSSVTISSGGSLDINATRSLIFGTGGLLTNSSGATSNITGSGSIIFNGTGTIAGGNAIGLNSLELNGLATISVPSLTVNGDLILNSGSSLSATPTYGSSSTLIYNTGGSYGVNLEWTGNSNTAGLGVPNNVSIRNNTTLNMPGTNRGQSGTMNIEIGTLNMGTGDLYVNGDWTRHGTNGVFNPNGKAIFFNRAGTQNITVTGGGTEIFNYLVIDKPSGSLVLNSSDVTHITINSTTGNGLEIRNAGSLDLNGNNLNMINAGGSILASGGARNIISTLANGSVNVQASKSVSSSFGGSLVFGSNVKVALSAGMDFGNSLSTIQGTLQITSGGFVNNNPPTYDAGSTLRYFSGSTYGRGLEWSATSGPGYPYHVDIDQNGTVTTLDLSNGGSALRQMAGNLNINNGGNLSMGAMSQPLVVKGNVNIGGASSGSLVLSSAAGGDIQIAGNLTRNAGGTFTQNGREVTMNGTSLQSISNNISSFDYLNIDNSGAGVQINNNTTINTRLRLSNGLYDLNGFTNTMANGSQIRRSTAGGTMSAAPTVGISNSYDVQYDATMTSGVEFVSCLDCVRDLKISAGTLTLNGNKTINRNLQLAGDLDIAAHTFTFRGRVASSLGSGNLEITSGARSIIGTGIFDIIGLGGNTPTEYTKVVTNPGAGSLNFSNSLVVKMGDGRMNWGTGNPTIISGILQVAAGGTTISNSCYYAVGSTLRFANNVDYQVNNTDLTWAAGAINSGLPGIPWNIEVMDNGTDLNLNDVRALRNDLNIYNGSASFTLNAGLSGSFNIGGNWTRTGATTAFNHNSKKVVFDKQGAGDQTITANGGLSNETFYDVDFQPNTGNVIITGTLRVLNALNLISGKVDLNGNELIIGQTGSNGSLTGGGATNYFISGSSLAKLTRYTTSTGTTYNFPVGETVNYTPMSITLNAGTSVNSNAQISMSIVASTHPMIGVPGSAYLTRYWSAEPLNFGGTYNYDVVYTYVDADVNGVEANLQPYKYSAGNWVSSVGSGFPGTMGTSLINPGTNTINWSGLTTFSDFTGNGNGSPLPISLISFNAKPVLENVEVTWTTASETNNDYFTVERSRDGINFKAFAVLDGAGNSNEILNYEIMDFEPYEGLSYYRLKQTDFDGKFEYSDIKSVNFSKPVEGQNWTVFPNPSDLNGINLVMGDIQNDLINIRLVDVTGKLVHNENVAMQAKGSQQFISFENISIGIYYLTVVDGNEVKTVKVVLTSKQ